MLQTNWLKAKYLVCTYWSVLHICLADFLPQISCSAPVGNCYLDRSQRETGTWGGGEMADSAWVLKDMLTCQGAPQFLPLSASYGRFRHVFVLWLLLCFFQRQSAALFNIFSMALSSLIIKWGLVKGTLSYFHTRYFLLLINTFCF